jgi:hypothetical protein
MKVGGGNWVTLNLPKNVFKDLKIFSLKMDVLAKNLEYLLMNYFTYNCK